MPMAASASMPRAPRRIGFLQVQALAAAPGFGLSWTAPNPDAEQPAGEIRLRPEAVIRGKLIDLNGKPIAGVEMSVKSLRLRGDDWIGAHPPEEMLNWPRKFKTDDQGRFTLAGIGRDMTVYLSIRDPRIAKETVIEVQTTDPANLKDLRYVLQPTTIVRGPRAGRRHRTAYPSCDRHRRLQHQLVLERRWSSLPGRRERPIHGQCCARPVLQHPGLSPRRSALLDPRASV